MSLVVFCGVLFFPFLGTRDLVHSHEARAAQDAQMILDEGHWLVPRLFDQHLELQKPPLYYWLVACIGWLQGGHVDAWAVRLPAALSAVACVVFLFFVGIRTGRPLAGFGAAVILASCVHFTWLAQVGRIDMPLTAMITFALGAFYLGRLENKRLWHALGYVALGLGLLLKGPIALVLPAVVVGAIWLRERKFDWRATTLWWGLPMTLGIAAPWYVWANIHTDNQLWEVFLWYHNFERGLGSETLAAHPWWFYGPRLAVDLLPWSLVMPLALWGFWRNPDWRMDNAAWLGLIWFAAIAFFLSLMRFKRADYLLPAYPGVALFLGCLAERLWHRGPRVFAYASGSVLVFCAAGWLVYGFWFIPAEERERPYRDIAHEIRMGTEKPVVFFRAESHLLAYHVGQPMTTVLEWENLEIWASRPFPVYVVMPESCAREWRDHLSHDALHEVLRTADHVSGKRDRPLVVMRTSGKRLQ